MPVGNIPPGQSEPEAVVLSPFRAAFGKKHRIYARPEWIQRDGQWMPIEDAIEVTYNGHGAYEIRCGKDDRIFFEPLWDTSPFVSERLVTTRRFGPTLDLKGMLQKDITWRVLTQGAVTATDEGWIFDRCQPGIVGLFFDKWFNLMPRAVTRVGNEININVMTAQDELNILGLNSIANLDPDTINPVTNGFAYVGRSSNTQTFQQVVDGNGTFNTDPGTRCRAWNNVLAFRVVTRSLLRFDTSAYPSPVDASLTVSRINFEAAEREFLSAKADFAFPLGNNANYVIAKTSLDSYPVGEFVGDPGTGNLVRTSPDIVASGHWESSVTADFCIAEAHDIEDDTPGDDTNYQIDYESSPFTYLEITPSTGGTRLPLTGVGK